MCERGIYIDPDWPEEVGNPFRLGVVHEPKMPEHEGFIGWITIPYLREDGGVLAMKFRRPPYLPGKQKYMNHHGCGSHLYGTQNLGSSDIIGITEGELDTVVATDAGIPSVAVPGVNGWRDEWRYCFEGYSKVLVFGDGDDPGRTFAAQMASIIPNARAVPMPDGHDVSSLVVNEGRQALLTRAGLI